MMLGLGIAPPRCATQQMDCGPSTDCSSVWNWLVSPACWSMDQLEWAALAKAQKDLIPPTPKTPPPDQWTTPPESGKQAEDTIDAIIKQQNDEWKQQVQDYYESLPDPPNSDPCGWFHAANADGTCGTNWGKIGLMVVGLGVGIFVLGKVS